MVRILIALAAFLTATLSAQWQLLARKDGAEVERFYQSTSGMLFVQLSGGTKIFRSFDGGVSWSLLELPSLHGELHFAPCADSIGLEALVIETGATFYRSTDIGLSWQEIPRPQGIPTSESIVNLEGLRYGGLIVTTKTASGIAVYLSRDRGESAERIGELPETSWRFLQAHDQLIYCFGRSGLYRLDLSSKQEVRLSSEPYTSFVSYSEYSGAPVVYWAIRNGIVVRSTDAGASWSDANNGLPMLNAAALLEVSRDGTLFCFLPSNDSTTIYRRFAFATQWTLLTRQGITIRDIIQTSSGTFLAATPGGVYSSEESGMFWSNSSSGIQGISLVCAAYTPAVALIAASQGGEVFRSVNNGLSWSSLAKLPIGTLVTDTWMSARGLVLVGTTNGLWCSTDGSSLMQCSTATSAITDTIVSVTTFKDVAFAATSTSAYYSTDGVQWLAAPLSLPQPGRIVQVRSNDSVLLVATSSSILAIDALTPPSFRTIATLGQPIHACDIAADGTIGVVSDSGGVSVYHRYRIDGTLETRVAMPLTTIRSLALSRGGRAWIAANGRTELFTIGRTDTAFQTDTTIPEFVLYLRRQPSGELLATTAEGSIYRTAVDSILTVESAIEHTVSVLISPASDQLRIVARIPTIRAVQIYNALGRIIATECYSIPQQSIELKLPGSTSGYYLAVVQTLSGWIAQPFANIR